MGALLPNGTKMIVLQFSFSNEAAIPANIRRATDETPTERSERKANHSGREILPATMNVGLGSLTSETEHQSFRLVDAFAKERIHAKGSPGQKKYWTVRYVFAAAEIFRPSEKQAELEAAAIPALVEMTTSAMWRVRAFDNPFYQGGEVVEGRTLSINCEVRTPLRRPDGSPVTIWQKDAAGERVGDKPLPIEPDQILSLTEGLI